MTNQMTEQPLNLLIGGIAVVPLIVALVEVAKQALGLPARWAAPLAVALGLLASFATRIPGADTVVLGLALGLSAVGLYSGARGTVGRAGSQQSAVGSQKPRADD